MPNDALSSALFGKTRRSVLGLLFAEPDRTFHLREIVRRTQAGQGAVQRELQRLGDAGIILREGTGRAITYRVEPASPVFEELRGLLTKTVGVSEHLRQALAPLSERIAVSFVYGSYAKEMRLRPGSDIDLMVIGDVTFGEVVESIASAERVLGREINPTTYAPLEFAQRVRDGHHFLSDVLKHPKLFLIGEQRELDRLGEVRLADDAPGDSGGDPRSAGRRRARSAG